MKFVVGKVAFMPNDFLFKTMGNHGTLERLTDHSLYLVPLSLYTRGHGMTRHRVIN